jgi:acylphosphatase
MSEMVGIHVLIEGRVQGVGFRFFTKEQAQKLGLTGWVRNTFDGDVEAYAEGLKEDLEIWLTHLQRGPGSAFVTNIKKEWSPAQGKFRKFQVVSTL